MAVTQQLARVDAKVLAECHTSVDALNSLCTLRLAPADDYLDLDWAPGPLQSAAVISEARQELQLTLRLGTAGEGEVNPRYREASNTVFEHPVSSLGVAAVHGVASALDELAALGFPSEETASQAFQRWSRDAQVEDPGDYLRSHFQSLREFYRVAAERDLCTVMWWD